MLDILSTMDYMDTLKFVCWVLQYFGKELSIFPAFVDLLFPCTTFQLAQFGISLLVATSHGNWAMDKPL